jgi:hypothetical protein
LAIVEAVERAIMMRFGSMKMTGSSSSMAEMSKPLASYGVDGITVFKPATCVNSVSGDWLCVWPPRMPPPYGMRTVIGTVKSPAER